MPIVEVEVVCQSEAEFGQLSATTLASALGRVFGSGRGTAWVKLRFLSSASYAENDLKVGGAELPAFVSVLHARLPQGQVLATEAKAITNAVASFLGRDSERIHVRYEPSAAGRQAFGGNLVS
jgi:phenylpyruvate tautomerase PptA (4-oxalocrotonate tautomerase family)